MTIAKASKALIILVGLLVTSNSLLTVVAVKFLGECEANCGPKRQCVSPYQCARSFQDELKEAKLDPKSAYCNASAVKKSDTFFCYLPEKFGWIKEACPTGTIAGQSCNPWDFTSGHCFMTPIGSCCKGIIGGFNSTHYTCEGHQRCYGGTYLQCRNVGPDRNFILLPFVTPNDGCADHKCGQYIFPGDAGSPAAPTVPTAVSPIVPTTPSVPTPVSPIAPTVAVPVVPYLTAAPASLTLPTDVVPIVPTAPSIPTYVTPVAPSLPYLTAAPASPTGPTNEGPIIPTTPSVLFAPTDQFYCYNNDIILDCRGNVPTTTITTTTTVTTTTVTTTTTPSSPTPFSPSVLQPVAPNAPTLPTAEFPVASTLPTAPTLPAPPTLPTAVAPIVPITPSTPSFW